MKKFLILSLIGGAFIWSLGDAAQAMVLQSADEALSNDTFVFRGKSSNKNKKNTGGRIKAQKKHNEIQTASDAQTSSVLQNPSNEDTYPSYEDESYDYDSYDYEEDTPQNPDAGYGYTQKYASKLFQTFSGYITVEQKDIPNRLGVTKGSTIQFNLVETPDAIWAVELDEKIGKILRNSSDGKTRTLVIQAVAAGNTRLFLDNISTKDNDYRIIFSKKMSLLVDE